LERCRDADERRMMSEQNSEMDALTEEFGLSEEQLEQAIHREWAAMRSRGEQIRVGDASRAASRRWLMKYGAEFISTLRRR